MKLKLLTLTAISVVLVAAVVLFSIGYYGNSQNKANQGLWEACGGANASAAAYWLAKGADIDAHDVHGAVGLPGQTPLLMCAHLGNTEIVEMLLLLGADPNAADDRGLTALHQAQFASVANLLVKYGADLHKKDKDGLTALQWRQKNNYDLPDDLKATLEGNGPASKSIRERQLMKEQWEKEGKLKKQPAPQP